MSATGDLDELGPFKTMPTVSYRWAGSAGTKKFWEDWDGTSSLALTDWSSEWRAPSPKKPDSKNGGGSKAKKDRNRNGTPPHHKKTR